MALRFATNKMNSVQIERLQRRVATLTQLLAENEDELAEHRQQLRLVNRTHANDLNRVVTAKDGEIHYLSKEAREAQGKCEKMKGQVKALEAEISKSKSKPITQQREQELARRFTDLEAQLKTSQSTQNHLTKQLQREKAANLGKLPYMTGDTAKAYLLRPSEDDEEPGFQRFTSSISTVKTTFQSLTGVKQPTQKNQSRKRKESDSQDLQDHEPTKKRARSSQEEAADELEGLTSFQVNFRTSIRDANQATSCTKHQSGPAPIDFIAVCEYDKNREIIHHFLSKDLKGVVEDLWQRIDHCIHNIWSKDKGDEWLFDFQRSKSKRKGPVCVTRAVQNRRTKWRPGYEGMFACKDCVEMNLPCFAFVKKQDGDLWLLPLHKEDRMRQVKEEKETRWWMNDDTIEGAVEGKTKDQYANAADTDALEFVVYDAADDDAEDEFIDDAGAEAEEEYVDEVDDGSDEEYIEDDCIDN